MDFKKTMDVKTAVEKGFTFTVCDIDGVEGDATISVVGVGSRSYTQASAKYDAYVRKQQERKKEPDPDTLEKLWCEVLAKCTTGWTNVEDDGEEVEFSVENAIRMYSDYPPLRAQVADAIGNVKAMLEGN